MTLAAVLAFAAGTVPAAAGQPSAATLYALNCMGCHHVPEGAKGRVEPLRGQFAHTDRGRVFFIHVPAPGERRLTAEEERALVEEIVAWKRSCSVILQQAPLVRYSGERSLK
jgi:hypothetical protein